MATIEKGPATLALEQANAISKALTAGVGPSPSSSVEDKDFLSAVGEAFSGGIRTGTASEVAALPGLVGVGLQAVGLNELGGEFITKAQKIQEMADSLVTPPPQDIQDIQDFFEKAAFAVGQSIPIIGGAIATGGLGSLAGKVLARTLVKRAIRQAAKGSIDKTIERSIANGILAKLPQKVGTRAALGNIFSVETTSTALEARQAGLEDNPYTALAGGALKTGLEALTPLTIAGRFGLGPELTKRLASKITEKMSVLNVPQRLLASALIGGVGEATTEVAQEAIDLAIRDFRDENFNALGPAGRQRLSDAAFGGGIVGSLFGLGGFATVRKGVGKGSALRYQDILNQGFSAVDSDFIEKLQLPEPRKKEVQLRLQDLMALQVRAKGGDTEALSKIPEAIKAVTRIVNDGSATVDPSIISPEEMASIDRQIGDLTISRPSRIFQSLLIDRLTERDLKERFQRVKGSLVSADSNFVSALRLRKNPSEILRSFNTSFQVEDVTTGTQYRLKIPRKGEDEAVKEALASALYRFADVPAPEIRYVPSSEIASSQAEPLIKSAAINRDAVLSKFLPNLHFQALGSGKKLPNGQPVKEAPGFIDGIGVDLLLGTSDLHTGNILFRPLPNGEFEAVRIDVGNTLIEGRSQEGLSIDDLNTYFDAGLTRGDVLLGVEKALRVPLEHYLQLIGTFERVNGVDLSGVKKLITKNYQGLEDIRDALEAQLTRDVETDGLDVTRLGEEMHLLRNIDYERIDLGDQGLRDPTSRSLLFGTTYLERLEKILGSSQAVEDALQELQALKAHLSPAELYQVALKKGFGKALAQVQDFRHFKNPESIPKKIRLYIPNLPSFEKVLSAKFTPEDALGMMPKDVDRILILDVTPEAVAWIDPSTVLIARNAAVVEGFISRSILENPEGPGEILPTILPDLRLMRTETVQRAPEVQRAPTDQPLVLRDQGIVPAADVILHEADVSPTAIEKSMRDALGLPDARVAHMSYIDPDGPLFRMERSIASKKLDPRRFDTSLDKWAWYVKKLWNIPQIAFANSHIPGVPQYYNVLQDFSNTFTFWISRADQRAKEILNLGPSQQEALASFTFDLASGSYLKPDETPRWPTVQELEAAAKRHGLSKEAFVLWERINEDFAAFLNRMEDLTKAEAARNLAANKDPNVLLARFKAIEDDFNRIRQRPYFPYTRFGDFTVIIEEKHISSQGNVTWTPTEVHAFPTKAQRDDAFITLSSTLKDREKFRIRRSKFDKSLAGLRGMPRTFLEHLMDKLDLTKEQRQQMEFLLVETSPGNTFRKHLLRRKEREGYSKDLLQVYSDYFFRGSNYMARMVHDARLNEALNDLRKNISELSRQGQDVTTRVEILEYLTEHKNYLYNPGNELANLRSFFFSWYLGFLPKSAFVNLTQVPMVAYPYLAARFGDATALSQLGRAFKDLRNLYAKKPRSNLKDDGLLRAIELGIQQNFLEESQATELAATAQAGGLTRLLPAGEGERFLLNVAHTGAFLFQRVESLNRRVTFTAAYRAALKALKEGPNEYLNSLVDSNQELMATLTLQGLTREEATAFLAGKDAVIRSQFEYARWARPELMRGKKSVLFLFLQYVQNILWFLRYSPGRGRAALLLLGAAGLLGMPFAQDAGDLAKFLARNLFHEEFDLEVELRKLLNSLNVPGANILLHGALSEYGLGALHIAELTGVPIPHVDISSSLSLGDIIPGTDALARQGDFQSRVLSASTDVGGAAISAGMLLLQALADDNPDGFKRWERAMPSALKSVSKAYRFATRGEETDRSGGTILTFDKTDPQQLAEIAAQALGFSPSRLREQQRFMRAAFEHVAFWRIQQTILLTEFDYARRIGDPKQVRRVRELIFKYNRDVPDPRLRITAKTIRRSLKGRVRRRALTERGLPTERKFAGIVRKLETEAFPTVREERI